MMKAPLPPGQRERADFPRFGLTPFRHRFPRQTERAELSIAGAVANEVTAGRRVRRPAARRADLRLHCVTTWSRRGCALERRALADFHARVIGPAAQPRGDAGHVILRGQDGARTCMLLEDLLAPDVLLADTLDGAPLNIAHGAPLRLVAPAHYGYKSVKALCRIEFALDESAFRPNAWPFMDHLRARVAREERGRGVPGWLLRWLYRPLIGVTVRQFDAAMKQRSGPT